MLQMAQMADWMMWLIAAGLLVMLEIFTGTFYLLMISVGLAAGGLAAMTGAGRPLQYVIAALVGIVATIALRHSKLGKMHRVDSARDPNVNLDIGQAIVVDEWKPAGPHEYAARAMYRGAMWDVVAREHKLVQPGTFIIREVRGSQLIVSRND